jgi:hypothetical protein
VGRRWRHRLCRLLPLIIPTSGSRACRCNRILITVSTH